MKKSFSLKKTIGKKNIVLAIVASFLVVITLVGASFSWIEEVSQVEFTSTNDSQQSPLHIGSKILKSDAVIQSDPNHASIDLSQYFNKSGDMHLSPCYSDGDNFFFPVEGKNTGSTTYRTGTKDDANVNYLSATFRVKSDGAATSYWFEKSGANNDTPFISFKKGDTAATDADLLARLRVSITTGGTTTVYALNNNGNYYTVENNAAAQKSGRRMDEYTYYSEAFNNSSPYLYYKNSANKTNKPNQGAGDNLNGNTLFSVPKYDSTKPTTIKTVTVKVWLECKNATLANNTAAVDVADINLNLVSSWAKTRRIYIQDSTINQEGRTQEKWLSHNGSNDNQAGLYWALTGSESANHWEAGRVSTTSAFYYVDIPAVYANTPAKLYRKQYKNNWNSTVWDTWETTFPNTYHSEVFTVYSSDFGSWKTEDVHAIYVVNSAFFTNMWDYMWDHNTEHGTGVNDKVVKNADWPGIRMQTKSQAKTNSQSLDVYPFFYNADYDRIIFNNGDLVSGANQEYQTQDLWLTSNEIDCTFDMTTLTWFHTKPGASTWSSRMPSYSASNTYLYSNMVTNGQWRNTRFAYGGEYSSTSGNAFNGTSSSKMLCKIYCKAAGDYECKLCNNGTWYGAYKNGDQRIWAGNSYTLGSDNDHQKNLILKELKAKTVYRFYFEWDNGNPKISLAEGEALT